MDSQRFNLTHGGILDKLLQVSIPIIGTQLMLMGYNLVDMFLLGRVGSDAVAASGTAGMYMWLANGVMLIGRMGAEIGVAQYKGRGDREKAFAYSQNSLLLASLLGFLFMAACVFFSGPLIGFLNIQEAHVATDAKNYLFIIGLGFPFLFISSSIAGTFTGAGNSRVPFFVNGCGLLTNIVLDPLFIFTFGWGVIGAAIATVIAQGVGFGLSVYWLRTKSDRPFARYELLRRPDTGIVKQILRWSVPVSAENMLFTFFSMIVARYIASYGSNAITVYRVGVQAESLCWLICLGFSSGLTAFVGQNFGAGRWTRIWSGFRISLVTLVAWGTAMTVVFLTLGGLIFSLFVPEDPKIIAMGREYMWILAFCQVFFCLESIAAGCFRGMGRTAPASIASIICNGLRVPVVHFLTQTELGLNGVWVGMTATAIMRGIWVFVWFLCYARKRPTMDGHANSISTRMESARMYVDSDHGL